MKGIDIAKSKLGLQEVKDKNILMDFFKKEAHHNDIVIDPSTTPWCAAFVNACERAAGNKGTGKLNARSFLDYGTPVDIKFAKEGDIAVFERGTSNWQGHVTYVVKVTNSGSLITCLGGNQHDSVNESNYIASSLLGIRRP